MNVDVKIEIDLLDFCKKGKFDLLKIGMSKQEVISSFPEPDGMAVLNKKMKMEIWRYGNFELHFSNEKLESISTDYIQDIKGGDKLIVNKWIFSLEHDLSLIGIIKELNSQYIDYEKNTNSIGQISLSLLASGVELLFDIEDRKANNNSYAISPNMFRLVAIRKR